MRHNMPIIRWIAKLGKHFRRFIKKFPLEKEISSSKGNSTRVFISLYKMSVNTSLYS